MDTLLQKYLNELKSTVSQMAGLVEESIELATKALAKKEVSDLEKVFLIEEDINKYNKKIDRDCFKLLARQSPVATDLRFIIVSTKMSVDLERMGDLACSMSHCINLYLKENPVALASEIPKMADLVRMMVRQGLDSFINNDENLATEVLQNDKIVDQYRNSLSKEIKKQLKISNQNLDAYLELLTIIRNLERIGDHATNIAEEVIFLIKGEDIRHLHKKNQILGGDQ
jgi:phosphate transport system protein